MSLNFNTATRGLAMIRNANRSGTASSVPESEKSAQKAPEVREGSVQDRDVDRDVIRTPSTGHFEVRNGRLHVTFGHNSK
jgi:hypothetical protein